MSECLSEAWRGFTRQLPSARILMGGSSNRASRGALHSSRTWLAVLLFSCDDGRRASSHARLACAPLLFCSTTTSQFSTSGLSPYVIDDLIHSPQNIQKCLITTFDQPFFVPVHGDKQFRTSSPPLRSLSTSRPRPLSGIPSSTSPWNPLPAIPFCPPIFPPGIRFTSIHRARVPVYPLSAPPRFYPRPVQDWIFRRSLIVDGPFPSQP